MSLSMLRCKTFTETLIFTSESSWDLAQSVHHSQACFLSSAYLCFLSMHCEPCLPLSFFNLPSIGAFYSARSNYLYFLALHPLFSTSLSDRSTPRRGLSVNDWIKLLLTIVCVVTYFWYPIKIPITPSSVMLSTSEMQLPNVAPN